MEYPQNPRIKSVAVRMVSDMQFNQTKSGRAQVLESGPETLALTVNYNRGTLTDDYEMRPLWAFLNRCRGQFNAFDFTMRQWFHGTGTAAPAGTVEVEASTGLDVKLMGLPAAKTIRLAGDLIQFANSPRAYVLAQDLNTSAAGKATARLCSPLLSPVPAGTAVNIDVITLRMRLDKSTAEIALNPAGIHSIKSIGLIETIE